MINPGGKACPTYSCRLQHNRRWCPGTSWYLHRMCCRAGQFSYSCSSDPKPRTRTWAASQPHCWACSHRSALLPAGIDQAGTGPSRRPEEQALGTCCKPHHQCKPSRGPCRIQHHDTLKNKETRATKQSSNIYVALASIYTHRSLLDCLTSSAAACSSSVWLLWKKWQDAHFPQNWQALEQAARETPVRLW